MTSYIIFYSLRIKCQCNLPSTSPDGISNIFNEHSPTPMTHIFSDIHFQQIWLRIATAELEGPANCLPGWIDRKATCLAVPCPLSIE